MKANSVSVEDIFAKDMKDSEFKADYEENNEKLASAVTIMEAREAAGYSQRDLAKIAHVPQSTLVRIEAGENTSMNTMSKIAHALNKKLVVKLT